jgi:hypothetical protein
MRCLLLRLRKRKAAPTPINASPATPPTTPPAIAPVGGPLDGEDVGLGVAELVEENSAGADVVEESSAGTVPVVGAFDVSKVDRCLSDVIELEVGTVGC